LRAKLSAQQIARRRANGDRQIKDAEDATALALGKKIGNKSRSDGYKCCLAHSNQRMANQQLPIGVRNCGEQRKRTPENGA
jgi:hypothetical protein